MYVCLYKSKTVNIISYYASLFFPPSLMSTVIIIHFIFLLPLLVLTTSQLSFIFYFYPHHINRTRRVYMHSEEEGEYAPPPFSLSPLHLWYLGAIYC